MEEKLGKRKRTRSQIGKASRNRGKQYEREVANQLKERGFSARRTVQFDGLYGHDLTTDLPFNFECKRVESLNIYKAMNQSREDASRYDNIPTVVHRKNKYRSLITMELIDFIDLLQWATGYVDDQNTLDLSSIRKKMREKLLNEEDAECL